MVGVSYGAPMNTERLLNLVPVNIHFPVVGSPTVSRSMHAVGNSPEGLAYAIKMALRGGYAYVEATDVQTGERYYLAAA